jgi:hypothetical protein
MRRQRPVDSVPAGRSPPAVGRSTAARSPGRTPPAAGAGLPKGSALSEKYSSGVGHDLTGLPTASSQPMLQAMSGMSLAQVQQLEAANLSRYGVRGGRKRH